MNNSPAARKQESKPNPFVYGKPLRISDFFNRDEIIDNLLDITVSGRMQKDVWVTGERQVGKTSLLKYIQRKSKNKNFDRKIELYETGESLNVSFHYITTQSTNSKGEFYRKLLHRLEKDFSFQTEPSDKPVLDFIDALKDIYSKKKYYIVFLVDEFDAFLKNLAVDNPNNASLFLSEINELLEGTHEDMDGKIFSCIFTANRTLRDSLEENDVEGSGSGLVLERNIDLPWFNKEQVEELAHQYLKNHHTQFSELETSFCFKMTQGYPYFVQLLYHIMYKQKQADPDPKSYISKVKEEYGKNFKETVKVWSGTNMPKRTLEKLQSLVGDIVKKIGDPDPSLSLVFKGIGEFLKTLLL